MDNIDLELKLKALYVYTIVITIPFGLGILIAPDFMLTLFGWPSQDPIVFGVTGSVYLAFGLLSILGFRNPKKFIPILLMQFTYKVAWFIGVVLPLLITGQFQVYGILYVVIFASYIVGDILVIPFSDLLAKE